MVCERLIQEIWEAFEKQFLIEKSLATLDKKLPFINYQLTQLITDSTRVSSYSNYLIDVFITNSSESIISSGVYPLSISDHDLTYAIRKIGLPKGKPRYIECRNFKNFDEKQFTSSLKSTKWPLINEFDDINKACDAWKSMFLEVIDKHAPCRSFRVRNSLARG
jgi:hypothetical protein